ncbi:MAG: 50S ribosomal protein L18 [Elusimicrobia bacterium]|nr:50S ribosomal protein L18 [Elusimicrobiota bacterium]
MKSPKKRFELRKERVRNKISGTSERPRLSVHRGHKNIYAQVIDDVKGITLASASTLSKDLKADVKVGDTVAAAKSVGALIAKNAKAAGVSKVVFDRKGYEYTGKVKALADAAREGGLEF